MFFSVFKKYSDIISWKLFSHLSEDTVSLHIFLYSVHYYLLLFCLLWFLSFVSGVFSRDWWFLHIRSYFRRDEKEISLWTPCALFHWGMIGGPRGLFGDLVSLDLFFEAIRSFWKWYNFRLWVHTWLLGNGWGCRGKGLMDISFTCNNSHSIPYFQCWVLCPSHPATASCCGRCSSSCSPSGLTSLHLRRVRETSSLGAQSGREPGPKCGVCRLLACALLSTPTPSAVPVSHFLSHLGSPAQVTDRLLMGRPLRTGTRHLACSSAICFSCFIVFLFYWCSNINHLLVSPFSPPAI